jgi:hypothetical protein
LKTNARRSSTVEEVRLRKHSKPAGRDGDDIDFFGVQASRRRTSHEPETAIAYRSVTAARQQPA